MCINLSTYGGLLLNTHTRIDTFVRHFKKTQFRSETGPYPSDLDGMGFKINKETYSVVPAMVPRAEKAKFINWLSMFDCYNIKICSIYNHIFPWY
jgi:hypothetical protein